mgnify:CR=1 FL=1
MIGSAIVKVNAVRTMQLLLLILAGPQVLAAAQPASTAAAAWPKQSSVKIKDVPESELCRETQRAVTELRDTPDALLTRLQDPRTRESEAVEIMRLTFYPLRTKAFTTVDKKGA